MGQVLVQVRSEMFRPKLRLNGQKMRKRGSITGCMLNNRDNMGDGEKESREKRSSRTSHVNAEGEVDGQFGVVKRYNSP